ncbi:SPOSA6832_03984 [Sporobolomyces salmonicolor]|uniref:Lysosomal dipeptide transporter MFSD1 n=1 Tax=Sporidiobolus salmonicolor TaxID=5005 RepID=A0A0D6EQR2_SPOSA|nr:SPOSA6832_03984 [Sporobolomyces salmonicolor]
MDGRSDDGPPRLATRDEAGEEVWAAPIGQSGVEERDKDARKRLVMLVCACLLGVVDEKPSICRHFGSYVLGPIKKSLKTTESGFAALISAFELLNTVTPLISGFLVPRYGAARVGLAATGAVLLGQIIVCLAQGDDDVVGSNMGGMIAGLLLFGSGISPLAVVQETVILSNNPSGSRFVARSVAIGLVFGKTSSFLAGSSSDWLHSVSPRMPFIAASGFAALSFAACVIYALMERSLHHSAPSHPTQHSEALEHKHRTLPLSELARFGDPFWLYIAVCGFAGIWYTTIHLSTHLLQAVYGIDQSDASSAASVLLLSASFVLSTIFSPSRGEAEADCTPSQLYPTLGWLLDKRPSLLSTIYLMVPSGIAISYFILLFLPSIIPYKAAFVPAALGIGGGPLLLVLVVPRMVQRQQVSFPRSPTVQIED